MSDLTQGPNQQLNITAKESNPNLNDITPEPLPLYQYTHLSDFDSIRLITLYPGLGNDPIHLTLASVRLSNNPIYNCLSYTWGTEDGDATLSCSITCDNSLIHVTKNCLAALHLLRSKDEEVVIWVDAICINQNDNAERSQQIALMRDVYLKADVVLIYLGAPSEDTCPDLGISITDIWLDHLVLMAQELRALKQQKKNPMRSPLLQQLLNEAYEYTITVDSVSALCDGFYDFVERKWWDRVWVVQEVAFASRPAFVCGARMVDYCDFQDFFWALRRCLGTREGQNLWDSLGTCSQHLRIVALPMGEEGDHEGDFEDDGEDDGSLVWSEGAVSSRSGSRSNMYDEILIEEEENTLLKVVSRKSSESSEGSVSNKSGSDSSSSDIILTEEEEQKKLLADIFWTLDESRELQATDPRDKIFAILSLVDEFGSILGPADYSKSIREVFTSVVKSHISLSKSLYILSYVAGVAWDDVDDKNGRPSWVPNWATPALYAGIDMMENIYCASSTSTPIYEILDDDKELRIKGIVFDTLKILDLADTHRPYGFYCTPLDRIPGWKKSCQVEKHVTSYPTGEPVREALWRSMCWNMTSRRTTNVNRPYPAPAESSQIFSTWHDILTSNNDDAEIQRLIYEEEDSFHQHVIDETPLCVTGKGYFAAVPYVALVGDVIAILSGGAMPFVLRGVEGGWRLIGHCYLHGGMEGQVWPGDEEGLEWISIR